MEIFEDEKYVKILAESLWSGTATAMVGSGFSLNAKPHSLKTRPMSSWAELIRDMKDELGLTDSEKDNYDALNTAELYQATFGRAQLEHFLEVHLPDQEYDPGTLHKDFVNLPWADIFTTNYDTLLERAMNNLSTPYHRIVAIKDIPGYQRPRLVKLHGSFGAERPLVFTATDYRRYPVENAPFVNMVQEAIMENSLCLIGFSGDDPNFRQWIGWVRDNLGVYRGHVYLCGVLNLTIGKRRLLESLGVTPIDLYPLVKDDVNQIYTKGLEKFFGLLHKYRPIDPFEWKLKGKSLIDLERTYPGWLIPPSNIREALQNEIWRNSWDREKNNNQTDSQIYDVVQSIIKKKEYRYSDKEISDEEVLEELYGLLWEHDIAINFFTKQELKNIRDWLGKYVSVHKNVKWLECMLILMKHAAICNFEEEFYQWEAMTSVCIKNYPQYIGCWYYWKCRMLLRHLEFEKCREVVEKWPEAEFDVYEGIWRASIYCELGEYRLAYNLVKKSLSKIRLRLLTSPNDISLLSREGWALYFQEKIECAIGQKNSFSDSSLKRFNQLHVLSCDPCREIEYLSGKMRSGKGVYLDKAYDYDPDTVTYYFFSSSQRDSIPVESILYLIWSVGLPLRMNSSVTLNKEIEMYFSHDYTIDWRQIFYFIVFSGNDTVLKLLFTRFSVASLSDESMEELRKTILSAWLYFIHLQPQKDNKRYLITWQGVTTEILSRILIRMDFNELSKIADELQFLNKKHEWSTRNWVLNLRKRLSYCLPENDEHQSILQDEKNEDVKKEGTNEENEDITVTKQYILAKDFDNFKKYGNQLYSEDIDTEVNSYFKLCFRYTKLLSETTQIDKTNYGKWSSNDAAVLFEQLKQIYKHFIDIRFDPFHNIEAILRNTLIIMRNGVLKYLSSADEDKKKYILHELYELRKRRADMEYYFDTLLPYIVVVDPTQSTEVMCTLIQDLWSSSEECTSEALYGIRNWIAESQEKIIPKECPLELKRELFYKVLAGKESALDLSVDILNDLLKRYPKYMMSDEEEQLLVNGMSHLYQFTDFNHIRKSIVEDDPREYEKYPRYQKALSQLAATLYDRYQKRGDMIPEILEEWKERSKKSCLPEVRRTFATN